MKNRRELFKSFMLMGLLLSAMIMTQAIFYDDSFAKVSEEVSDSIDSKKINAYMLPQSFYASFGGMSYTKVYNWSLRQKLWGELRPVILNVLLSKDEMVKIDKKTYFDKFQTEGLLIKMPMALSAKDLFDVVGDGSGLRENIEFSLSEMLLVRSEDHTLYFYDGVNNQYYSIRSAFKIHDLKPMIERIKEDNYIEYRTIAERFSLEKTVSDKNNQFNYTLFPFEYDQVVPEYELVVSDLPDENQVLKAVFGSQMNFVKMLEDVKGSKIFMYGYGDKILTLHPNGSIQYRAKVQNSSVTTVKLSEAIGLAIQAIEKFGAQNDSIYLSGIDGSKSDEGEWTLSFGYHIGSYRLVDEAMDARPIVVKIMGREVTEIRLNTLGLNAIPYYRDTKEMYRVDLCIEDNFEEVSSFYFKDQNLPDEVTDPLSYFYRIYSDIEGIDMRYYPFTRKGKDVFLPVWQVVIAQRTYLFDATTGELIKTFK